MIRSFQAPLAAVLLALALAGCKDAAVEEHARDVALAASLKTITVDELDAMMADAKAGRLALAIYDANVASYWKSRHIPGATWIESSAVTAKDLPADKATTLVFYCECES